MSMVLFDIIQHNTETVLFEEASRAWDTITDEEIFELLDVNTAKKFSTTTRARLNTRRFLKSAVFSLPGIALQAVAIATLGPVAAAASPVITQAATSLGFFGSVLFGLSEAGILTKKEKASFIRFQGLTDIHAKRLSKLLKSDTILTAVKSMVAEFNKQASENQDSLPGLYKDLIAGEYAVIVLGYAKVMENNGADEKEVKALLSGPAAVIISSLSKGAGVWNRIKNILTSGLAPTIKPLATFALHFTKLVKLNPDLDIEKAAIALIKKNIPEK